MTTGVRVCFVTGPNMVGKLMFLNPIAVAHGARAHRVRRPRRYFMEFV